MVKYGVKFTVARGALVILLYSARYLDRVIDSMLMELPDQIYKDNRVYFSLIDSIKNSIVLYVKLDSFDPLMPEFFYPSVLA